MTSPHDAIAAVLQRGSASPPSVEALRATIERLESCYESARQDLARKLEPARGSFPPEQLEPEAQPDKNGRYILLDALTAIVQARTALARIEAGQ